MEGIGNDNIGMLSAAAGYWNNKGVRLAAIGTTTGGVLTIIDWLWQGYLDLTPGADAILHQVTHPAYYVNDIMLFVATMGILLGLFVLHYHVPAINKGLLWRTGLYISILGLGLFALGLAGYILHGLLDFTPILHVINILTGIGNVAMYLGAFPLGLALLQRNNISRLSACLLLLQLPVVIFYMFGIFNMTTLTAGILIGGMYGGAWIRIGFSLWEVSKGLKDEVQS